jgi:hypothetical protein
MTNLLDRLTFGTIHETNHVLWGTEFDEWEIRTKCHLYSEGCFA